MSKIEYNNGLEEKPEVEGNNLETIKLEVDYLCEILGFDSIDFSLANEDLTKYFISILRKGKISINQQISMTKKKGWDISIIIPSVLKAIKELRQQKQKTTEEKPTSQTAVKIEPSESDISKFEGLRQGEQFARNEYFTSTKLKELYETLSLEAKKVMNDFNLASGNSDTENEFMRQYRDRITSVQVTDEGTASIMQRRDLPVKLEEYRGGKVMMIEIGRSYYLLPSFDLTKRILDGYPGYENCLKSKVGPKSKILAMSEPWNRYGQEWSLIPKKDENTRTKINMGFFEVPEE